MRADGTGDEKTARKLVKDYLLQDEDMDPGVEGRYKLLLTKSDRDTFMRLVDGRELNPTEAPRLVDDLQPVRASSCGGRRSRYDQVLAGLGKLLMVDIALEKDHDNPQLIFESLNSTGLDLSQADLIRNYVLMGQPPKLQKEIYTNSWCSAGNDCSSGYQELV